MTDPAGLLPSSFARIRFDVLPGSRCSATSGVDPTQSSMVGYLMLTLPESTHRMIVQSLLPENNEPNLSSERLNLTPVIRKEESVKHQGTQDLDRQSLGSGERFPKSEGLDHGEPLAPPLARDDPATDSHIQTVDLAQLFAKAPRHPVGGGLRRRARPWAGVGASGSLQPGECYARKSAAVCSHGAVPPVR